MKTGRYSSSGHHEIHETEEEQRASHLPFPHPLASGTKGSLVTASMSPCLSLWVGSSRNALRDCQFSASALFLDEGMTTVTASFSGALSRYNSTSLHQQAGHATRVPWIREGGFNPASPNVPEGQDVPPHPARICECSGIKLVPVSEVMIWSLSYHSALQIYKT